MKLRSTLAVSIVLTVYAPTGGVAAAQPPDFGFRFSVRSCLTEQLDTFTGIFAKELGTGTATTHITLTDAQIATLYRAIEDIGFFDYSSPFNGIPTGVSRINTIEPSVTYHLEVRKHGAVQTVDWSDGYSPTTAEADRLRDLMSMMIGFIHEQPDYKRLPPATVLCL